MIRTLRVCDRSNPNSFSGVERTESGSRQGYDGGAGAGCNYLELGEVEGQVELVAAKGVLNILMQV